MTVSVSEWIDGETDTAGVSRVKPGVLKMGADPCVEKSAPGVVKMNGSEKGDLMNGMEDVGGSSPRVVNTLSVSAFCGRRGSVSDSSGS